MSINFKKECFFLGKGFGSYAVYDIPPDTFDSNYDAEYGNTSYNDDINNHIETDIAND